MRNVMTIVMILAVALFDFIVCYLEIPKMRKQRQIRDIVTFSVLLLFGTVITVMKTLDMKVPDPSTFLRWLYSPLQELMKFLTSP